MCEIEVRWGSAELPFGLVEIVPPALALVGVCVSYRIKYSKSPPATLVVSTYPPRPFDVRGVRGEVGKICFLASSMYPFTRARMHGIYEKK